MKTLVTITLIMLTFAVSAQVDTLANRLDYTNYCLYKYQKENKIGIAVELIGAGTLFFANNNQLNGMEEVVTAYENAIKFANSEYDILAATATYNADMDKINNRKKLMNIAGGAMILGGGIIHVASYRWLKRAYFYPGERGLTVMVKF